MSGQVLSSYCHVLSCLMAVVELDGAVSGVCSRSWNGASYGKMGQYQGFVQGRGMVRHMARWGSIRGFFKVMEWCFIGLDWAVSGVCSRSGNCTSYG